MQCSIYNAMLAQYGLSVSQVKGQEGEISSALVIFRFHFLQKSFVLTNLHVLHWKEESGSIDPSIHCSIDPSIRLLHWSINPSATLIHQSVCYIRSPLLSQFHDLLISRVQRPILVAEKTKTVMPVSVLVYIVCKSCLCVSARYSQPSDQEH